MTSQTKVSFAVPATDRDLIKQIAHRAAAVIKGYGQKVDVVDVMMDLTAVHANGCKLRLSDLLAADNFNLLHDIVGIENHLDRETGQLSNHFLPRFSAAS